MAPTPSGFLHLGNLYSFVLTKQIASKTQAGILLRIDDMDSERVRPEYIRDVFDTLRFAGIKWKEGPKDEEDFEVRFSQRHRLPLYQSVLQRLRDKNLVYACTCSRSEVVAMGGNYNGHCRHKKIPLETPGVAWRLNTSEEMLLKVKHGNGGYSECTLPASMADFVVRKKDGLPSYQVCSMSDDVHFEIDLIVRGQDLWDSTLAQLYLATVLNEPKFLQSIFHHHHLLRAPGGGKLSKSAGDTSVAFLRKEGVSWEEVMNKLFSLMNPEDRLFFC